MVKASDMDKTSDSTLFSCSYCGRETEEELENWGVFKLCPECAEFHRKYFKGKKPRSCKNIVIGNPQDDYLATYNPRTGNIEMVNYKNFAQIQRTVNHEFMHFIVYRMLDIQSCYQYDNVRSIVDLYHSERSSRLGHGRR